MTRSSPEDVVNPHAGPRTSALRCQLALRNSRSVTDCAVPQPQDPPSADRGQPGGEECLAEVPHPFPVPAPPVPPPSLGHWPGFPAPAPASCRHEGGFLPDQGFPSARRAWPQRSPGFEQGPSPWVLLPALRGTPRWRFPHAVRAPSAKARSNSARSGWAAGELPFPASPSIPSAPQERLLWHLRGSHTWDPRVLPGPGVSCILSGCQLEGWVPGQAASLEQGATSTPAATLLLLLNAHQPSGHAAPFHSLCAFSRLIQGKNPKPVCKRGAICKSLLMKELLPSVLSPLRWPGSVGRDAGSSSQPASTAPAKNREQEGQRREEGTERAK